MVEELSAASQTYQAYLNLQVSPPKEQAQKLTGDLELSEGGYNG